jgi:hypothetical protein
MHGDHLVFCHSACPNKVSVHRPVSSGMTTLSVLTTERVPPRAEVVSSAAGFLPAEPSFFGLPVQIRRACLHSVISSSCFAVAVSFSWAHDALLELAPNHVLWWLVEKFFAFLKPFQTEIRTPLLSVDRSFGKDCQRAALGVTGLTIAASSPPLRNGVSGEARESAGGETCGGTRVIRQSSPYGPQTPFPSLSSQQKTLLISFSPLPLLPPDENVCVSRRYHQGISKILQKTKNKSTSTANLPKDVPEKRPYRDFPPPLPMGGLESAKVISAQLGLPSTCC